MECIIDINRTPCVVDRLEDAAVTVTKLSYTIAEAVEASSFSRSRLFEHIRSGRLESFMDGGRRHIPADALHKLINDLRAEQSGRAA